MRHALFAVKRVTPEIVFVVDHDGPMSITNDAEYVVELLNRQFRGKRIVYRDSMRIWDELFHDDGTFTGFGPYNGEIPS